MGKEDISGGNVKIYYKIHNPKTVILVYKNTT